MVAVSIDWTNADEVITEAVRVTSNERGIDYDAPEDNFARIAAVWNVLLDEILGDYCTITEGDVARMMIAVKLVRDAHTPKRDNRVDLVGYTRCLERVEPTCDPNKVIVNSCGRITAEQAAEADAIYHEMKPVEKSCATCNNWCGDSDQLTEDCLGEKPYVYRYWEPKRWVEKTCTTCLRNCIAGSPEAIACLGDHPKPYEYNLWVDAR